MKTLMKFLLLLVVTVALALGFAAVFVPGGVEGLLAKVFPSDPKPAAEPAPEQRPAPAAKPTGADELREAESEYDAGRFGGAIDHFVLARVDVDPDRRDRVARGLEKAVLAWALTMNAAPPSPMPDDPDAEVARRQAAAEKDPSEHAWYETTMYAAGCGLLRKLPYLADQAIRCASEGGPVATRLRRVLEVGVSRGTLLREEMLARGFIVPADPVGEPDSIRPVAKAPPKIVTRGPNPIYPPSGKFKAATKEKLAQAVSLEKRGTTEYDLCGPDNPQRKEHRKAALDLLKQAREIYLDAEDEDPDSGDLAKRLQVVLEMISHLNKETNLGD